LVVLSWAGTDEVSGWELESKLLIGRLSIEANLSRLNTESQNGFQFGSVPETQASAWLGYDSQGGLRAGVGARYAGKSFGGTDVIETPSYTLLDAMVSYQIDHWLLQLNARNLANKEYQSTCLARGDCFQGERRTVIASVVYRF